MQVRKLRVKACVIHAAIPNALYELIGIGGCGLNSLRWSLLPFICLFLCQMKSHMVQCDNVLKAPTIYAQGSRDGLAV